MIHTTFYFLALLSLLMGTAALYMPMNEAFPVRLQYYQYFVRKPFNWILWVILVGWTASISLEAGALPSWTIAPLLLASLGVILAHRMHQEVVFRAIDYPKLSGDACALPIKENMEVAVIECEGITKAYALDYVAHHHIVNDRFGDKIISLTYCAMCRSVIPFDVTELGPLFVGSFDHGNMVVADRRTRTFFQQSSFDSLIGALHPRTLTMIPYQILAWRDVKKLSPMPLVAQVSEKDLRPFELPVPGVWKLLLASERVPGLSAKSRDHTFPARTRVIGVSDAQIVDLPVYLKSEVLAQELVVDSERGFLLLSRGSSVNAFRLTVALSDAQLSLNEDGLVDSRTGARWDLRGKGRAKDVEDLQPLAISDEYWFSWKRYHPDTTLVRI